MTRTININGKEFAAFNWEECPIPPPGGEAPPPHTRDKELLEKGVSELRPGEATFRCDQSFQFDTPFTLKGDNRKFVIIAARDGRHVAKPY